MDVITEDERRLIDEAVADGRVDVLSPGVENEYAQISPMDRTDLFFRNKSRGARIRRLTGEFMTETPAQWAARYQARIASWMAVLRGF